MDCLLETRALTKEFKGFVAVKGVDLKVRRGEIHALIGPNGAGKTTFFNLLTKFLIPDRGQILYDGADITLEKPAEVARRGMVRSFQISAVFPHLTVLENVRIALQRALGTSFHFWKPESSLAVLHARVAGAARCGGPRSLRRMPPRCELPYGRKRALEIATTLAMEPELMLLDEPTQGMGHEDVDRITELIKKAAANRTVLMVEHNMSVVSRIADTITVLQRGPGDRRRPLRRGVEEPAGDGGLHGLGRTPSCRARTDERRRCSRSAACTPSTASRTCCTAWIFASSRGEVVTLLGRNGAGRTTHAARHPGPRRPPHRLRADQRQRSRSACRPTGSRASASATARRSAASSRASRPRRTCCCRRRSPPAGMSLEEIYAMFPNLKERRASQGTRLSGGEQQMLARGAHPAHRRAAAAARRDLRRPRAGDRAGAVAHRSRRCARRATRS